MIVDQNLAKIWDHMMSFDKLEPELALEFLIKKILPMVGAINATWVGSVRGKDYLGCPVAELLDNWVAISQITFSDNISKLPSDEAVYRLYMQNKAKYGNEADAMTRGALNESGKSRAHMRSDFLSDQEWKENWVYKEYNKKLGYGDVMHMVVNLDENSESWIVFHKEDGKGAFSRENKHLAYTCIMGAAHWMERMMLLRGGGKNSTRLLSSTEQKILRMVLRGMTDDQIAGICGFSKSNSRSHISSIYRKFNIKGKKELFLMFL